jgi:hypothetical protein
VDETVTDPEPYPTVTRRRAEGGVSAGMGRRTASGWKNTTYLFAPVTMMMGRAGPLGVDIMRVRVYVEVAVAVVRLPTRAFLQHARYLHSFTASPLKA